MGTKKAPNRLLAAVIAEAGVSNKGLAARVRALAQRDGRRISSDHVSVRRWLDGSMPRGRTSQYVALALGAKLGREVTPADLGLAIDTDVDLTQEAAIDSNRDPVEVSQRVWRDVRIELIRTRADLSSRAVELYEPSWRLPQAPMLSQDSWIPDKPIALEDIELEWEPNPPKPIVVGQEPEVRSLLPLRTRLQTFPSYSSAIRYLSPPALFENRPCYRLLGVSFSGNTQSTLRFGQSCYFDKIDMSETLSRELCSAVMNGTPSWSELPFRSLISDPYDLALRNVKNSITTLTIRRDPAAGRASFFLLRRDAAKVVTGGGEYGLVPGGEFQPSSISPDSLLSDLSIWRNMVREYSEELLGQPEHDGSAGRPIDYDRWPFFRAMQKARERGDLRVYVLGVALNALSLNATVVTVAVIDGIVFDSLFHGLARVNAEGEIVARLGENKEGHGVAFNEATVNHFLHVERLV
ncbi:MAG: helix-turn-helix domain-containing protein [Pseudonocardiaceae bacterium]